VHQSFEELKRGILRLLRPDFMVPLETVNKHSLLLERELAGVKTDQDLKYSLESIRGASAALADLVEDFIKMAGFRTGEAEIDFGSRVSLVAGSELQAQILTRCRALKTEAAQAQQLFTFSVAQNLPQLVCDLVSILECISRLFAVALKLNATAGERRITLDVSEEVETVALVIRAAGVQFPQALAEKLRRFGQSPIFEPLDLPGLGIGTNLMVVKGLLALHDARLQIGNDGDGIRLAMVVPIIREWPDS